MATEIFVHKMNEHMETAIIVSWLVKEGDAVQKGSPLMEVETEKATVEIEAPASGIIKGIRPGVIKGSEVPVGEPIAFIAKVDETVQELLPFDSSLSKAGGTVTLQRAVEKQINTAEEKILVTPAARKIAKELGIKLADVEGSGPGGRIREEDIHALVKIRKQSISAKEKDNLGSGKGQIQMNAVQKITTERMLQSIQNIPQYTLTSEADLTKMVQLREELKTSIKKTISITTFFIQITASVLVRHPRLNAVLEKDVIRLNHLINLGVALGTEEGLFVPVIKNANEKSLLEIDNEIQRFKENAKNHSFSTEDLSGATFTISNLGMFRIKQFNAIINPPQAAILAIGSIDRVPSVINNDTIEIRPKIMLSLTVDHRFIDGYHASHFLEELVSELENAKIFRKGFLE